MSHPLGPCARRLLRQTPAAFQRECRAPGRLHIQNAVHDRPLVPASASTLTTRRQPSGKRVQSGDSRHGLYQARISPAPATLRYDSDPHSVRRLSHSAGRRATAAAPAADMTTTNTVIVQNPQLDEDGNEMRIEISDRAAKRLQQIISSAPQSAPVPNRPRPTPSHSVKNSYNHLRVSVTSGGCHGFQYLMSLEPASAIESDIDTIFASSTTEQSTMRSSAEADAKVVLDESSLSLLKGSTVDYTSELIGSQFVIRGNPRAKSSCGCGTSFDIDD